jgi:hypothetical protein
VVKRRKMKKKQAQLDTYGGIFSGVHDRYGDVVGPGVCLVDES